MIKAKFFCIHNLYSKNSFDFSLSKARKACQKNGKATWVPP